MIDIRTIVVSPFQQNARLLIDPKSRDGMLIDPGDNIDQLVAPFIADGIQLESIFLTHSHIDHAGGVAKVFKLLREKHLPTPTLLGHKVEDQLRKTIGAQAKLFGLPEEDYQDCPEPDIYLDQGDIVTVGHYKGKIFHTPGHSPGHLICYFESIPYSLDHAPVQQGPVLLAGDTLFKGSIGRTDLPGGNASELHDSIKNTLYTLPDETLVLSGHGPNTTIGDEKRSNPFVRG